MVSFTHHQHVSSVSILRAKNRSRSWRVQSKLYKTNFSSHLFAQFSFDRSLYTSSSNTSFNRRQNLFNKIVFIYENLICASDIKKCFLNFFRRKKPKSSQQNLKTKINMKSFLFAVVAVSLNVFVSSQGNYQLLCETRSVMLCIKSE